MSATTLPLDWKPANYNPNFNASDEFEELGWQLDLLARSLNVFAEISNHGVKDDTVELNRNELAGMFLMLCNGVTAAAKRNDTLHKYVCNLWGQERLDAQKAIRAQQSSDEIQAAVESAIEAGKLLPALKEWAIALGESNREALTAYLLVIGQSENR